MTTYLVGPNLSLTQNTAPTHKIILRDAAATIPLVQAYSLIKDSSCRNTPFAFDSKNFRVEVNHPIHFIRDKVFCFSCNKLPRPHTMDAISKFFLKQKMGSVTDQLPSALGGKDDKKDEPAKTSRQIKKDMTASRAERDAEFERKKTERAANKTSVADRWAKNKTSNS